jgi:hypothetical protein
MIMKKIYTIYLVPLALAGMLFGCRKLIAVGPPVNQLTGDKVFTDSASTLALLDNTYALFNMTVDPNYTSSLGMYTDELNYTGEDSGTLEFLQSTLSTANVADLNIWKNNYFAIYECNDIIEGLNSSTGIKATIKNEFICEAKFLRAYAYFYLVNTYGAVPLILETNVNETSVAARTDSLAVYQQIIQDLNDAQAGLAETYTGPGKVRANKWAAIALLARVYLYQKKYPEAEQAASNVINSGLYTPLLPPSSVFLADSKESILQLATQYGYTQEGNFFVVNSGTPTFPVTNVLLSAFEPGDLRRVSWIDSSLVISGNTSTTFYFPYKYHNTNANIGPAEYLVVLRIAEQYLIRAEARLQQNNINGAVEDLNIIRQRAGLNPLLASISASSCFDAIMHERQVELFAEWGNRFLDLKRTGRIDSVMSAHKAGWKPKDALLPVPQNEITSDSHLTQNPGY